MHNSMLVVHQRNEKFWVIPTREGFVGLKEEEQGLQKVRFRSEIKMQYEKLESELIRKKYQVPKYP